MDLEAMRRAFDEAFAEPERGAAAAPSRYILLRFGSRTVALRMADITGVVALPRLARLPDEHPALLGIAVLRGGGCAAFSLPVALGAAPEECRWAALLGDGLAVAAPALAGVAEADAEIDAPESALLRHAIRHGDGHAAVLDARALRAAFTHRPPSG